jgi:hypothetical protein
LLEPGLKPRLAATGGKLVSADYDTTVLAGRIKNLYAGLVEEKRCAT